MPGPRRHTRHEALHVDEGEITAHFSCFAANISRMPVPQSSSVAPALEPPCNQKNTTVAGTRNDLLNCAVQGQIAKVGECNAVTHDTAPGCPTPYAQLPVFICPPTFHASALRSCKRNAGEEVADTHGLNYGAIPRVYERQIIPRLSGVVALI